MAKRKAKRGEVAKAAPPGPPTGGGSLDHETHERDERRESPETQAERLLRAACAKQGVEPESLIDFKIYPDRVVLILLDFRKITYSYADLVGFIWTPPAPPTGGKEGRRDALENTLKQ